MPRLENTAVSKARPPDLLAGYRLETLVGRGGMGEVYRGTQLSLGRPVAIKILATDKAKDESFIARFEKEAAALAALSHPNIVSIIEKGKSGSTYYLVMEFVDGPSLREELRSPNVDLASRLRMMMEVCRAIEYAHGRGVVHRDLKPENILFDAQAGGIAKVTDFGLASVLDSEGSERFHITETNVAMGTLSYMAPEQRVDAANVDHRADIFSLGVIFYELLVGEVPTGHFAAPSAHNAKLDRRLDVIIARCLKAAREDRYDSVLELIADLESLVPISMTRPPRRVGLLKRVERALGSVLNRALRAASIVAVLLAIAMAAGAIIRMNTRSVRQPAGVQLVGDLGQSSSSTAPGRIDRTPLRQRVRLGKGAELLSLTAAGGTPSVEDAVLSLPAAPAALVLVSPELDGAGLSLSAVVATKRGEPAELSVAKEFILGSRPEQRAGLLVIGTAGHYVGLFAGEGAPATLEWSLGDARQGVMSAFDDGSSGSTRLELLIDSKSGELRAYSGLGKERTQLGEPLQLGTAWKRLLGPAPKVAIGCIQATCRFGELEYASHRE